MQYFVAPVSAAHIQPCKFLPFVLPAVQLRPAERPLFNLCSLRIKLKNRKLILYIRVLWIMFSYIDVTVFTIKLNLSTGRRQTALHGTIFGILHHSMFPPREEVGGGSGWRDYPGELDIFVNW